MNPNQVNKNKNPLLSCAITGGFEEFTGSGIVLAAAEKPVFTIGTPLISDTDNFSDVSLDRDGTSDTASTVVEPSPFYSPLAELDSMGNLQNIQGPPTLDLTQDQQHIDTNLNPISAALAQLPNAASTVFSTFSNIIKGSSQDLQQNQAPRSMEPPPQEPVNPVGYMYTSSFDPNAPPPSFFSPSDDSLFKKQSSEPAINNNFRLGGHKKKTYAHIPGLSSNQQTSMASQNFTGNQMMPPMPLQAAPSNEPVNYPDYQAPQVINNYNAQQKEPEKSSKFSLTSLLPSQLLEKIPSTKSLFSLSSEPTQNYEQQQYNNNQDFSVMTSINDQVPQLASNYFNNSHQSSSFVEVNQPVLTQNQTVQQPPTAVNFFNPQQFNTSPFAQAKVSEQTEVMPLEAVKQNVNFTDATQQPETVSTPPNPTFNQAAFNPHQFSTPVQPPQNNANEPPKIETISADTNCAPPPFFNPNEATNIFKTSQADDGKPKNPYSSRLSRGVGLYKTRTSNAVVNTQSVFMPPMPEPTNFINSTQFPSTVEQQKVPSRPPSIPPLPSGNFGAVSQEQNVFNSGSFQSQPPVANSFFNPVQNFENMPMPVSTEQAQQLPPPPVVGSSFYDLSQNTGTSISSVSAASDNIQQFPPPPTDGNSFYNPSQNIGTPVNIIPAYSTPTLDNIQQLPPPPAPVADVSSFFNPSQSFDNSTTLSPSTESGPPIYKSLFFSRDPNADQSAVFQEPPQPPSLKKSDLNVPEFQNVSSAFDFFQAQKTNPQFENMPTSNPNPVQQSQVNFFQPSAPESSMSDETISTVHNFFANEETSSQVSFNSTIPSFPVKDSRINDFSENSSMADNVGSSLSLFATSELNSRSLQTPRNSIVPTPNVAFSDKLDDLSMMENVGSSLSLFTTAELDSSAFQQTANLTVSASICDQFDNLSMVDNIGSSLSLFATSEIDSSSIQKAANLTIPTVNDTANDNSDKVDSLSMQSENIGSTLSLFATSELDSSSVQKPTLQLESLIPKYLDTQAAATARTTSSPAPSKSYRPVYRHWFYQNLYWHPFAMSDSLALDEALATGNQTILTDGGRFEVNLTERRRTSIYWLSGSNHIRRCSWFYKNPNGAETNLIPFDEETSEYMEAEYEKAVVNNSWNYQVKLPNTDEFLVIRDPVNIEYHQMEQTLVVKRGVDEFVIEDGEEAPVDHLIISVSNFGDKIDDSADDLRSKCMEMILHYYSEAFDCGQVGRVEVLPISLNSVDVLKMKETNSMIEEAPGGNAGLRKCSTYQDVIMKTAFYCNDLYYQNIMNHLAFSLNEIVSKFRQRNPEFKGEFSLIATSFEALFLFDLLLIQENAPEFWKLSFNASNFYSFGMPSNLLTIRNSGKLQHNFELKNCKKFLNVVHRLDPIAQRIEPLIKPEFSKLEPESIENETVDRTDYTIADGSSLETFSLKNYFSSELIILRITNEIYGALKMDSGSL